MKSYGADARWLEIRKSRVARELVSFTYIEFRDTFFYDPAKHRNRLERLHCPPGLSRGERSVFHRLPIFSLFNSNTPTYVSRYERGCMEHTVATVSSFSRSTPHFATRFPASTLNDRYPNRERRPINFVLGFHRLHPLGAVFCYMERGVRRTRGCIRCLGLRDSLIEGS